jgi:predicted deacylase
MRNILIITTCLIALSPVGLAQEDESPDYSANAVFVMGDISIPAGETYRGNLVVPSGDDGIESFIPITVHNGDEAGSVLAMIAGIHGSEYSPIIAMQKLAPLIKPSELSGTLIIVHIANMPAFSGRTIYFGPDDLKNLNRSFPGDIDGTITDRIAYVIRNEVMMRADYLVDIHSGDGNESLRPSYSAYYGEAGGEEVIEQSRRLAISFGLGTIVRFAGSYDSLDDAIYTSAQAVTLGIPAIDIESGELGSDDDKYIDPIIRGSLNIMRELDMISGEPKLAANPLVIGGRSRIYSNHDGMFYPDSKVETGDYVTADTRLGVITDYHGNILEEIFAPDAGVLLILFGTPPVNSGDNIVVIGKLPAADF